MADSDILKMAKKIELNSHLPLHANAEMVLYDPELARKVTETGQLFVVVAKDKYLKR